MYSPSSDAKESLLFDLSKAGKALPSITTAGEGGVAYAGDIITIGPNTFSNDYDVEKMWKKIRELQAGKRVQRGVRTVI